MKNIPDDPPPFLHNWRNVYGAVILYLAFLIAVFSWFSHAFSPGAAR